MRALGVEYDRRISAYLECALKAPGFLVHPATVGKTARCPGGHNNDALTRGERGYSVVGLEQNRIGWGASGRNGGQVIGGFSGQELITQRLGPEVADLIWDIGWRGNTIIAERVHKYATDCD